MDSNKDILEVAHVDGNHKNNNPENLCWLCIKCHRLFDIDLITIEQLLPRRDFVETMPKANWKKLMKDAGAKAARTRKQNQMKRAKK
ncbi:HNH endonuclease [Marine Group I thaumarchaeote]|nr:HNH endonuclease [Marine Group I thaumarchaeote]